MITRYLSIVFVFASLTASAQWLENFSESLTSPHLWEGDTSYFRINQAQQLQSNGPAASGKIFLQTYSNALTDASWSFWLKMNFESSTSNYAKIFLAASSADLLDPQLEAYYLKIGGLSGSKDGIDLYYQKGTSQTLIAKGKEGHAAGNPVSLRIKVLHDAQGNWEVHSDTLGGENFQLESTGHSAALFSSQAFGFFCVHSSTRRANFYFDDLSITGGFIDTEAPRVILQNYEPAQQGWLLSFNEPLHHLSVPLFMEEEDRLPLSFQWINPTTLLVKDTTACIPDGTARYVLLSGMKDRMGNTMPQSLQLIHPKPMTQGDVVINEILFNPFSYGVDFVELYNRTPWYIAMQEARIMNQSQEKVNVPETLMAPHSYRVLTKDSTAVSGFYALAVEGTFVPCNLPSFPDDKGSVALLAATGDSIDFFNYDQDMHHPLLESKEGVSLERVNADEPTPWLSNWQSASNSSGGATPGYVNSQAGGRAKGQGLLEIEPHAISPGTDGYRNYATIRYHLPKPGGSVRMDIFSLEGLWMCSLVPSGSAGMQGVCTWNGTDANLQPVNTGLYLLVFEFFHPDGDRIKVKDTISVLLH